MLTLLGIAFGTSLLSGIFGMAGGLILMGAYAGSLPVGAALALHGITQGVANGARAGLLWRHVHGRVLLSYAAGAGLAWGLLRSLRPEPEIRWVWLGLGLLPFAAEAAGRLLPRPDMAVRPAWGALAGFLVNGVQGIAGVAGPILDLFFVQSSINGTMTRQEVVATKAVTQALSHGLKVALWWDAAQELPPDLVLGSLAAAFLGTAAGTRVLGALREKDFRRGTRLLLLAVGAIYLWKAI